MAPPAVTNAVLAERFDNLEKLIKDLKGAIDGMEKRLSEVEKIEIACKGVSEIRSEFDRSKIVDLEKNLNKVEERVKKIEDALIDLIQTNKILRWLAGIFTAILIAVLIAILTGKVQVLIQ